MYMDRLTRKALLHTAAALLALGAMLFAPAWTFAYGQAWIYWITCGVAMFGITLHFLKYDPALIERRLNAGPRAETQPRQKRIMACASVLIVACFLLPPLDWRYEWSHVAPLASFIADVFVAAGFTIVFWVFQTNTHAAATVRVEQEQKVIDTGPYAIVRHPMYSGAAIMLLATPVALGSLWGLVPAGLLVGVLIWRLIEEEAHLVEHLAGYSGYKEKVRVRLIPGAW